MKENAILIRQLDVLKVYVDFSNPDAIHEVLHCERVSTIHTEETRKLSNKLGVHLMGYVDREGNDINNQLACKISGYDYLGSFMLLFKSDDKMNELGFNEDELTAVYDYLIAGKIIPASINKEARDFIKKHDIEPILPGFSDVPSYSLFFDKYPNLLCIVYDEEELDADAEYERYGAQLFEFADRLIGEGEPIIPGDVSSGSITSNGRCYQKNFRNPSGDKYYVFIQVICKDGEEVLIDKAYEEIDSVKKKGEESDFDAIQFGKDLEALMNETKTIEDTPEEAMEQEISEEDLSLQYIIIANINISWPKGQGGQFKGKVVLPLGWMNEEVIDIPYFTRKIKLEGYDLSRECVDLSIHFVDGEEDKRISLDIDEEVEVPFAYYNKKNRPDAYREGSITFLLERHRWVESDFPGKFKIIERLENAKTNKLIDNEAMCEIEFNDYKQDSKESYYGEINGFHYYPLLISMEQDLVIMNGFREDDDDEKTMLNIYFPVKLDSDEILYNDMFFYQDIGKKVNNIIRMSWRKK